MKTRNWKEIQSMDDGELVAQLGAAHERKAALVAAREAINRATGGTGPCRCSKVESELKATQTEILRIERRLLQRLWGSR